MIWVYESLIYIYLSVSTDRQPNCWQYHYLCLQASNAYLQLVQGDGVKMVLDFIKEMPKPETQVRLDLSSVLGTLFFTWVILQLFPVSTWTNDIRFRCS